MIKGDKIHIITDLPGLKKTDIHLYESNGQIDINADAGVVDDFSTGFRERKHKRYRRTIPLPAQIDEGHVEASYYRGVLSIILHKAEKHEGENKAILVK